jgi:hypothetical protein
VVEKYFWLPPAQTAATKIGENGRPKPTSRRRMLKEKDIFNGFTKTTFEIFVSSSIQDNPPQVCHSKFSYISDNLSPGVSIPPPSRSTDYASEGQITRTASYRTAKKLNGK